MEVEMNGRNITIGVLAILAIALVPLGGSEILEPEQYENAYVCDVNEQVGVFLGGISGTAYSGYPHAEDRTDPARCKYGDLKGKWISLEQYAKDHAVDPLALLINSPSKEQFVSGPDGGQSYCCGQNGCNEGNC